MLTVMVSTGSVRYALDMASVIRVLPLAALKPLPSVAAPEVAGLLDFHGSVIPVIDLNVLLTGRRCPPLLSTRIVLVRRSAHDGGEHVFGLRAPRVDLVLMDQACSHLPSELPMPPWLGRILRSRGDLIQEIRPEVLKSGDFSGTMSAVPGSAAAMESGYGDSSSR